MKRRVGEKGEWENRRVGEEESGRIGDKEMFVRILDYVFWKPILGQDITFRLSPFRPFSFSPRRPPFG